MPKDENRIEHLLFMSGIEIRASRLLAVGMSEDSGWHLIVKLSLKSFQSKHLESL